MQFIDKIKRIKSEKLFKRAKALFPGGVNSPVRAFRSVTGAPLFIANGDGTTITDEDGNKFIDFCASWGPLIHGHNDPDIQKAILKTVKKGTSFGTPTKIGVEMGELILKNHSYLEKLRFVCSGTEAVMSAVRLARGFTGKNKVVKFEGCYHGHVDALMVKAGSGLVTFGTSTSSGVPDSVIGDTIVLQLNDLQGFHETLQKWSHEIACVIIEPVPANNGLLLQDHNYLSWLRKYCDEFNVLLIFDEVISGFRLGFEGAAGHYNIKPDLITFGKIIGGGLPVGAYGGRADIMSMVAPEGPVYQAGTLSGNPVTLAAGTAALKKLLVPGFYEELSSKTAYLVEKLNGIFNQNKVDMHAIHIGSIFWIKFTRQRIFSPEQIDANTANKFKIIHHELLQRGIYFGPSAYEVGFVSGAHTHKDLDALVTAMDEICKHYNSSLQ
ncbi:MAG: glutamate-1-semialdehyde 2,1-aminomutase [Saprospiraceae bacterium]|nr:glutamate-1-semialdehyde 2,1-aminomutase [Saprospiraceae bacterium]